MKILNKILIINDIHSIFIKKINNFNIKTDIKKNISYNNILKIIDNYDGLVLRSNSFIIDDKIITKSNNLKFIARAGSGLDHIDINTAMKYNIKIINAPEGNKNAVAEHIIGMILSLTKNIVKSNNEIKNGIWDRISNQSIELENKTLGIVGLGHNGSSLANKMSSFNMNIIAYDKYKISTKYKSVKLVTEKDLFEQSDIVSINIPLNTETKHMIDIDYFNSFKKKIYFINTSRGNIVKTSDLIKAIKNGIIIGAALDVLEIEKFPELYNSNFYKQLIKSDKIILSSHIAGLTAESYKKIGNVLASKIIDLYKNYIHII